MGARFACAVNSCTAALHLALEALGVGPGDKVLVPTMTFTATAEVVRYLGADPVFLDVEYGSSLVTAAILRQAIENYSNITDYATLFYNDEQAVLAETDDPEEAYLEEVMPHKLKMYVRYVEDQNFWLDLRLILATLGRMAGLNVSSLVPELRD